MHKIPAGTLVVVADGTKARIFRNIGSDQSIKLKQEEMMEASDIPLQGPSGVAPPQQTVQQTDEASFAKHVAHFLNDGALKDTYSHVVLMADPQTLGQIRPQLHKETQERLVCEVTKTLTNSPIEDVTRALS